MMYIRWFKLLTKLKFRLTQSNAEGDAEIAGDITTFLSQITTFKANGRFKKPGTGHKLYANAKQRLLDIVTAPRPSL